MLRLTSTANLIEGAFHLSKETSNTVEVVEAANCIGNDAAQKLNKNCHTKFILVSRQETLKRVQGDGYSFRHHALDAGSPFVETHNYAPLRWRCVGAYSIRPVK